MMDDREIAKWIDYLRRPGVILTAYSAPEMLEMALEVQRLRKEHKALIRAMQSAREWLGAWQEGAEARNPTA